jgi:hypothetical protein
MQETESGYLFHALATSTASMKRTNVKREPLRASRHDTGRLSCPMKELTHIQARCARTSTVPTGPPSERLCLPDGARRLVRIDGHVRARRARRRRRPRYEECLGPPRCSTRTLQTFRLRARCERAYVSGSQETLSNSAIHGAHDFRACAGSVLVSSRRREAQTGWVVEPFREKVQAGARCRERKSGGGARGCG